MGVVLDVATLRSARQVLDGPSSRSDDGQFIALDVTALGSLLDAVCFADEIVVPDLEHRELPALARDLGEAVTLAPLSTTKREAIAEDARRWLTAWPHLENLIRVLGGRPIYQVAGSTYQHLVLKAVGVETKYESDVVRWIRRLRDVDESALGRPSSRGPRWVDLDSPHRYHAPTQPIPRDDRPGFTWFPDAALHALLRERSLPPMALGPHPDDAFPEKRGTQWEAGPEVLQFCANLAWTAFRTRCYGAYAADRELPYVPHPLRARVAGFAAACAVEDAADLETQQAFVRSYVDRLNRVYEEAIDAAASVGGTSLLRFPHASVLPYLVRRAGKRERLLDAAYELRDSRGARALRARTAAFEQAARGDDLQARIALRNELDEVTDALRQRLGLVPYRAPGVTFSISAGPLSVSATPRGGSGPSRLVTGVRKPWMVILWDVLDALAAADALGDLYAVLGEDA